MCQNKLLHLSFSVRGINLKSVLCSLHWLPSKFPKVYFLQNFVIVGYLLFSLVVFVFVLFSVYLLCCSRLPSGETKLIKT